ncbi:MAG: hypothetical protein ACK5P7_03105 [Bdellovibrio sp.]|jgi:hypothetical protein
MKSLILLALMAPMFAVAGPETKILVSKTIPLRMAFPTPTPFFMANEHGGSCGNSGLSFSYAHVETQNPMEFLPILDGTKEFINDCADPADWGENNRVVSALNAHVKSLTPYLHFLILSVKYELSQRDDGSSLTIYERMEFSLPEMPAPFVYSSSRRIGK